MLRRNLGGLRTDVNIDPSNLQPMTQPSPQVWDVINSTMLFGTTAGIETTPRVRVGLTIQSKCESLSLASKAHHMGQSDASIAKLIELAERGDGDSANQLFALLYAELHRLAKSQLARQGVVSLSATTLIHEAYLEMAGREARSFPDQGRFMAYASRVMRGLIIDHIRNRLAVKRGGRFEITAFTTDVGQKIPDDQELIRLSHALDELASVDGDLAQVVDLKFFCGFSFGEIAGMLGVSERTVQRKWEKARIYLHSNLRAKLLS
jgi:RNA polymerase sigma factor (TIGR02999 family)